MSQDDAHYQNHLNAPYVICARPPSIAINCELSILPMMFGSSVLKVRSTEIDASLFFLGESSNDNPILPEDFALKDNCLLPCDFEAYIF